MNFVVFHPFEVCPVTNSVERIMKLNNNVEKVACLLPPHSSEEKEKEGKAVVRNVTVTNCFNCFHTGKLLYIYRHNSENKINNNYDDKGFTVDR